MLSLYHSHTDVAVSTDAYPGFVDEGIHTCHLSRSGRRLRELTGAYFVQSEVAGLSGDAFPFMCRYCT